MVKEFVHPSSFPSGSAAQLELGCYLSESKEVKKIKSLKIYGSRVHLSSFQVVQTPELSEKERE